MNVYLERLKDGVDPASIIIELSNMIKIRDESLNRIFDRVAATDGTFDIAVDIVNEIPTECLQKNSK